MKKLLKEIADCVEKGKVDAESPHPPEMQGQMGADEKTRQALDSGVSAQQILSEGLIIGMQRVGVKFRDNLIFLPDVLMSARAMSAAMAHLRPQFQSGDVAHRGRIVLGTVAGDLHDIGKKIVGMFFEGGGWQVIDCGVDVSAQAFIDAIEQHQPDAVGLSALLTTTMVNMQDITSRIKARFPKLPVLVGGAPVTRDFADRIGADIYAPDPQGALESLQA